MSVLYNLLEIQGKQIYIVESHHHALAAWAELRRRNSSPSILLTFDHHTDTHSAFLRYSYSKFPQNDSEREHYANELVEGIDYSSEDSITECISKLINDEHIDAAIKSNIISKAFVISYSSSKDNPLSFEELHRMEQSEEIWMKKILDSSYEPPKLTRPFHYPVSETGIYIIGNCCAVGCTKRPHNDDCVKPHYDQAIETIFLEDKLNIIQEMIPGTINNKVISKDYILDIDLDYFHTRDSINPRDSSLFYELIRHSTIITIAKENICVDLVKYKNEEINSDFLLDEVLNHINVALT